MSKFKNCCTRLYILLTTDPFMQETEKDFCLLLFLLLIGGIVSPLHYNVIRLICFAEIIIIIIKLLIDTMRYINE